MTFALDTYDLSFACLHVMYVCMFCMSDLGHMDWLVADNGWISLPVSLDSVASPPIRYPQTNVISGRNAASCATWAGYSPKHRYIPGQGLSTLLTLVQGSTCLSTGTKRFKT